jgi:alanyl-tRNA synthetase
MSFRRLCIACAACGALAACNTVNSHIGDEDPAVGEAVKYNAAIQIINPAPVYAEQGAQPGDNGDKGAQAVKRYRTDKVKDVETMTTTSGSTGSGPR